MIITMLWFDNSKRPFEEKLTSAVQYYNKKYGTEANHCEVNQQVLESLSDGDENVVINGVGIAGHPNIRPSDFLVSYIEEE